MRFADFHADVRSRLAPFLQSCVEERFRPSRLRDACMHLLVRGKMLRATVALATLATYRPASAITDFLAEAAALELVQTFTLIHDDLPAMDNADMRRGVPSVHRRFGEDYALLAGDALLDLGFLVVMENAESLPGRKVKVLRALAGAVRDIMEGQALELSLSGREPELVKVEEMQWLKTGSLISASFQIGGILAGIRKAQQAGLDRFARLLGKAFQVKDDLLSEEGVQQEVGKTLESDKLLGRPTMVRVLGRQGAQDYLKRLQDEATRALDALTLPDTSLLAGFAEFLVGRRK